LQVRPDEEGPIKTINIDNVPREIRFYGDTAVILMADDDARQLGFQPGVRRVFFENVAYECRLGDDYVDIYFEDVPHRIKLGAPTRELYIDGQWFAPRSLHSTPNTCSLSYFLFRSQFRPLKCP